MTGNTAGVPSLVSSGTLYLAGGPNITLSQNGNSISISALAQSTQTQAAGNIAGIGVSTATQAGSTLGATLGTNGLSLAMPAWVTGGGGIAASLGGNTSGALALITAGTLFLAGGNNVTLSQNGNSVTISANTAAAATLSVSAGSTSGALGGLTFGNGSGVSFGLNNGTITASVAGQSTQTQPAGNIAGVGTTFNGANISASMTLNTNGLNLSMSGPVESGVGISAAGSSQSAGAVLFSNANGVSFGMNGSTVTASVAAGGGGGVDVSLGGNTTGTLGLISSGTLFLAGGNNVTLSQNGQSITISANTVAAANLSVSAGTTTGAFGGLTFSNSNNLSFGLNNGTITGTVNAPGLGTTFNGANLSGSMTLNNAGLNLSLSAPTESGIGISAAGSSQTAGNIVLSNANGVTFGMAGSTITASVVGGSAATTGGIYALGNTTGASSSSTYGLSSLNISLAGILSGGWSGNTFQISAPGTTGLTQLSAGMSTGGNTLGNTGLASAQLVLVGGNNVTLSGSSNGGSQTISIIGAAAGGINASLGGNTTGTLALVSSGTLFLAGGNNITLSQNGQSVTISGGAGGGASTGGFYALGNTTQNSSTTLALSGLSFNGIGALTVGYSNGSIQLSAPATSSISGTGMVSVSTNGSTVYIGANALTAYAVSNTTQSSSGTINGTALSFAGAGGVSVGISNGTVVISGGAAGGVSTAGLYALGNTTQNSSSTLNLSALSFNGLGGMTVGYSNGSIQLSGAASAATTAAYYFQGNTTGQSSSSTGFDQSLSISGAGIISGGWSGGTIVLSATQLSTLGLYAVGNTTQNSSTSLAQNTVSLNGLGGLTVGFSNGSVQLSAPAISSLSATGLASLSINGSTISIGAAIPQLSFFQPLGPLQNTSLTQNGIGSVQVYPAMAAFPFSASRADIMVSASLSVLAVSTEAQTLSMYVGLYSLNGSTLSLASSGSQSYAWSNLSGNSSASISGMRRFSAPININYTGGFDLFVGVMTNTTFANTNGISLSNVVVPLGPGPQLQGLIGQTQVNSMQFVPGQGFFSATSAALPASIGLSQILGAGSGGNAVDYYAPVQFVNVTA
jgi:hypothetical protein